jgi:hypothetical protein
MIYIYKNSIEATKMTKETDVLLNIIILWGYMNSGKKNHLQNFYVSKLSWSDWNSKLVPENVDLFVSSVFSCFYIFL